MSSAHLAHEHSDEREGEAAELVVADEFVEVEGEQLKGEAEVVAVQEEVLRYGPGPGAVCVCV